MEQRDFRILSLPESARNLPKQCIALNPGEQIECEVEGGLETANLIMQIANLHLDEGVGKVIMVWQDVNPPSPIITFKCVVVEGEGITFREFEQVCRSEGHPLYAGFSGQERICE